MVTKLLYAFRAGSTRFRSISPVANCAISPSSQITLVTIAAGGFHSSVYPYDSAKLTAIDAASADPETPISEIVAKNC